MRYTVKWILDTYRK